VTTLEIVAAVITAVSIWLATRENVWYFPTGIVSLVMYTWIFVQARLYAESALQVICLGLMLYGWYEWLFGGERHTELKVSRTPMWGWLTAMGCGVALAATTAAVQHRYTNNPSPVIDSSIFAFSIVTQWMTARKWIENWILWIIINVVSVYLYVVRHLYPTAVLYVVLLVLAFVGYREWKKSLASV
jgi:nicotinamide mononucleotide transporter